MNNPVVILVLSCIVYPLICWVPITVLITLSGIGRIKFRSPLDVKRLPAQAGQRDRVGYGGTRETH